MIQLREQEKILMVIRKHWFLLVGPLFLFLLLLLVPPLTLTFLPYVAQNIHEDAIAPLANFGVALYVLALLILLFHFWMDYYLDMWIVTEKRIIDVDQRGLFSREVSEIPMASVQDVTVEVHGIIQTMLGFGTIRIQTAGEREFTIDEIPHLGPVKDAILNYAHQQFATTQKTGL